MKEAYFKPLSRPQGTACHRRCRPLEASVMTHDLRCDDLTPILSSASEAKPGGSTDVYPSPRLPPITSFYNDSMSPSYFVAFFSRI